MTPLQQLPLADFAVRSFGFPLESRRLRCGPHRVTPNEMKPFNLRSLRIFETVAGCGSFSRAAEQLEMTQPAVSMHIRQLETDLGTALFDRQRRQRLTDAGRELLQHARIVEKAAFSPDGRRVVTGSLDLTARVWDANTGQALTPPIRHESTVSQVSFSPDGRSIQTA